MKRFFIDIIMLMKLDGKKENYRSLVVSQILLKYSDEDNPLTLKEIMSYLEDYGFVGDGKEKSIKRDIQQLRELYENEDEGYIDEHLEFNYRIDETYKIVMDGNNKVRYKAYYISQRPYELDDLRMLIECINSAKSISSKKAEELKEVVYSMCSSHQIKKLNSKSQVVGRIKANENIVYNIANVSEAIDNDKQISFYYLKHDWHDKGGKLIERRNKEKYKLSPYYLLIENGYYYVISYDESRKKVIPYRLDRMRKVDMLEDKRIGKKEIEKIDVRSLLQESFGMFVDGEKKRVTIRFTNDLLDTVIDKFGTNNVAYNKEDNNHFSISADIVISNQFFSWICGFKKKAKIMLPSSVVNDFRAFIADISVSIN